jgi:hypothetical protein
VKIAVAAPIIGLLFSNGKSYVLIMAKKWIGPHLGRLFANASGHPGGESRGIEILLRQTQRPNLSQVKREKQV